MKIVGLLEIGENVLDVCEFLDVMALAALDLACPVDRIIRNKYWEHMADTEVHQFPLWGQKVEKICEELKKAPTMSSQKVREVTQLRRTMLPPAAWEPWIAKASFCSLKLHPYTDNYMEEMLYGLSGQRQALPCPAAVPLSLGSYRGYPYVIGINITPDGQLDDNLCVGVEGRNYAATVPIMVAPYSGQCYIQLAPVGPFMMALAFKPLEIVPKSLRVWIHVLENGSIRFLRKVDDLDMEDGGFIAQESLPRWIEEYFGCVYYYGSTLKAGATVSVHHISDSLPVELSADKPEEMDVIWSLVDPESW